MTSPTIRNSTWENSHVEFLISIITWDDWQNCINKYIIFHSLILLSKVLKILPKAKETGFCKRFNSVLFKSYKIFNMWNITCNFSHMKFPMEIFPCEIPHMEFHMRKFPCEIPHGKFHMWNTCETHVKNHMWNITCETHDLGRLLCFMCGKITCVFETSHVKHMCYFCKGNLNISK